MERKLLKTVDKEREINEDDTSHAFYEIKAVHKKGRKIKIINNCAPGQPLELRVKQLLPFYKNKIHIYDNTAGKIGHIKIENFEFAKDIHTGKYQCRFSHWFDDGEFFEAYIKLFSLSEDLGE